MKIGIGRLPPELTKLTWTTGRALLLVMVIRLLRVRGWKNPSFLVEMSAALSVGVVITAGIGPHPASLRIRGLAISLGWFTRFFLRSDDL